MRAISLIVVHCSATREDKSFTEHDLDVCHRRRGFNGVGYHFYIRKNGDIKSTREIERIGAHVRGYNLDQTYFDLIISDIMMPKMDGFELVRSIRESGSSIPILMITARDAFDDMRLGFLSGSDDYMVKPININEMVLRVSALLRRAQMASERRQSIGGTVLECDSLCVTVNGESTAHHHFCVIEAVCTTERL